MKKKITMITAALSVFLFSHALFSAFPTIRYQPSRISASSAGEELTIDVFVDDVTNIGAFQLDMIYDPAVVHAQSFSVVSFMQGTGRTAFPVRQDIDNSAGRLTLAVASTGNNAGPDGTVTITTITFETQVVSGASTFELQNVKITDIDGTTIPSIRLNLPSISADGAGEDFTAEVWVDNATDLENFNFVVGYDPAVAHAQDIVLGDFITSTGRTIDQNVPNIDNTAGRLSLLVETGGENDGPAGSGILATLAFQSQAQGTTDLNFEDLVVSVEEERISTNALPEEFELVQNYPNPFNPETRIIYQLPKSSKVSLRVFNMLGQEIRILVDEERPAGIHEIIWNGQNNQGVKVAAGIYFARLKAEGFVQTKKMIFLP